MRSVLICFVRIWQESAVCQTHFYLQECVFFSEPIFVWQWYPPKFKDFFLFRFRQFFFNLAVKHKQKWWHSSTLPVEKPVLNVKPCPNCKGSPRTRPLLYCQILYHPPIIIISVSSHWCILCKSCICVKGCYHSLAEGPLRVNFCVCLWLTCFGLRAKSPSDSTKSLQRAWDRSAFLSGPGSNLFANICAAEMHPFKFFSPSFGNCSLPFLRLLNMKWFAWVLLLWCHNLYNIAWAFEEWLGRAGLFILHCEVYILPFLPALCLLLHSWLSFRFSPLSVR